MLRLIIAERAINDAVDQKRQRRTRILLPSLGPLKRQGHELVRNIDSCKSKELVRNIDSCRSKELVRNMDSCKSKVP